MDDRELISEFVVESREHLADIENQLLAIEAAGANADVGLVNTVFRAIHSIKGAAGFLGLSTVGQLAHDLENVLNLVRNFQLVPDAAVTDILLRSADKLRSMLDDIDHSNEADIAEYVNSLQAIVAGMVAEDAHAGSPASAPSDTPTVAGAGEGYHAGASEWEPTITAAPQCDPVVQTASAGLPGDNVRPLATSCPSQTPAAGPPQNTEVPRGSAATSAAPAAGAIAESNVRVSVNVLDRLMNLAGELVLSRNQLMQTIASSDHVALGTVAARVNQVTSELQETIMQTRLQPIGAIFGRFPRVVRDLSNALGKSCQLIIEGQEVELDKSIIEAVGDPLTHLIRNAVDHGIESAEARANCGKPVVGTVTLRAFHQAGKVNIQISDDGRGMDIARIKEKAVAKGLLSPDQAHDMSDREALQLIFRPGFSMAERVTEVSGRGVGMDVVKTNIERLGGTVTIDTQLGAGSTIHVRLPLTLAIIPSLIVRCAGRRYALPQSSIRELVRVKASDAAARIERIKRAEVFRLRGDLLPIIRLNAALDLDTANEAESALNIIVVEAGHLRYGLVVDGLCDSEEIVVKPLGRHMKGCSCLAGATILGDGNVALILDITGIAAHCQLFIPEEATSTEDTADESTSDRYDLLLFRNHPLEQFAVSMDMVARLERVRVDQIDSVGGKQILQYRGGVLPLLSLEDYIGCKPRDEMAKVYVVVFPAARREVGLIVPELIDIRSVTAEIDTTTFREPGISGSLVQDDKTVRLVDLQELTHNAHPEWYASMTPPALADNRAHRVLIAEDSDFFRKQLCNFLETEGYDVVGCEDGAVAWQVLQDPHNKFDLVVTDIEMPNMDGLELTRNIRSEPRLVDLPVVAVTSLAGEEDVRRGKQVGVNEYHIKLDRDQLVSTVARFVTSSVRPVCAGRTR
jgi:two-component system chemotaxis sensor kinase CheA